MERDTYLKCASCGAVMLLEEAHKLGGCPKCGARRVILPYEGWRPSLFKRIIIWLRVKGLK